MFENIIGNNDVKQSLEEAIKNKKVANSYMFIGEEGIGKEKFAKEFAKAIMCLNTGKNSEDNCDSCVKFDALSNPDYMEIHEEKNIIKIEKIRTLENDIAKKPIVSSRKVYVISDAKYLTEEAQNCLLKTLEEPPSYTNIVLVTSNENKLLTTIQSRCVKIKFHKLSSQELRTVRPDLTNDEIELLDGSLKDIDNISEKLEKYQKLQNIIYNIQNENLITVLNNSQILYDEKDEIMDLLDYFNILLFKNKLYEPIQIVEEVKKKIQNYNNYEMCIDYLLMNSYKKVHK